MLRETIFTIDPKYPFWLLQHHLEGKLKVGLLGWVKDREDDILPIELKKILVRTICQISKPIYFDTIVYRYIKEKNTDWLEIDVGWAKILKPYIFNFFRHISKFPLICTSNFDIVERLFDVDYFGWELQGQIVFLSNKNNIRPPKITFKQIKKCLSQKISEYTQLGIDGIMRPGVDGEVVGFYIFNEHLWEDLIKVLSDECKNYGINLKILTESEFEKTKWYV